MASEPKRAHRPATNLAGVLEQQGYALSKLAEVSGIPLRKLQALVAGTAPLDITLLWRVANAVGVPFGSLLPPRRLTGIDVQRSDEPAPFTADDGRFVSRPLFPFDGQRQVEFYELTIAAGYMRESEAHAPGTVENIVVSVGELKVQAGNEAPVVLRARDATAFQAARSQFFGPFFQKRTTSFLTTDTH
jgi:transcriptional regulator with XRE-family HTH domain